MAPGSLCLRKGDEVGLATWQGMRVIYSCCTCPPGAPTPVPGTCYPAFCGVSLGILESWWAEFWSGLEAMVGRPVWPQVLLLAYQITNFPGARWTPRLTGWERLAWIDHCFYKRDEQRWVVAAIVFQCPKLGGEPLSPCALALSCCHHKLNTS